MHLYAVTRGIKHDVDRLITELQGKYIPYEFKKGEIGALQLSIRPIQLWEICFPEAELQKVLNTLKDTGTSRISNTQRFFIRKMLKADAVPKIDENIPGMPVYKSNVEIALIGIKKDVYIDGVEMI
jgi:hypothetical protein